MAENNDPGNDPAKNDPANNDPKPGNDPGADPAKNDNMIPKSRFDQVNQQKNELNETLKGLVDELKQDIPQEYQDLIPDTKPADQIKWIRNAQKKGLFTKQTETSPDPETPGKSTKQVNTEGMDSFSMLSMGFKNRKK